MQLPRIKSGALKRQREAPTQTLQRSRSVDVEMMKIESEITAAVLRETSPRSYLHAMILAYRAEGKRKQEPVWRRRKQTRLLIRGRLPTATEQFHRRFGGVTYIKVRRYETEYYTPRTTLSSNAMGVGSSLRTATLMSNTVKKTVVAVVIRAQLMVASDAK